MKEFVLLKFIFSIEFDIILVIYYIRKVVIVLVMVWNNWNGLYKVN